MKKAICAMLLLTLWLVLMFGCSGKPVNSDIGAGSPTEANYTTKMLYSEGLPNSKTIEIDTAVSYVIDKFRTRDTGNTRYRFEKIDFINNRIYYIIRRFEDRPDHIVTLGYYAVDVFTGEVFDTKGLMDLVKLKEAP